MLTIINTFVKIAVVEILNSVDLDGFAADFYVSENGAHVIDYIDDEAIEIFHRQIWPEDSKREAYKAFRRLAGSEPTQLDGCRPDEGPEEKYYNNYRTCLESK